MKQRQKTSWITEINARISPTILYSPQNNPANYAISAVPIFKLRAHAECQKNEIERKYLRPQL
jgi:hypothetical protein